MSIGSRLAIRIGLVATGLLLLAYAGLYLFQDRMIFQSVALDKNYSFTFDVPFKEHFIPVPGERSADTLHALWFKPDTVTRGLVLYFHGNRGNVQRWGRYASDVSRYGYEVLVIDYRGYGKSTGSPSEATLYSDARQVMDWALGNRPDLQGKVVIFGRSLGAAVASHLASQVQPQLLILETPFDELRGVLRAYGGPLASLMPLKYRFSNADNLRSVQSRVIIFHGTNDRIVPLSSALRLRPRVRDSCDFIILEGGTHRNLGTFPAYRQKLREVLSAPGF